MKNVFLCLLILACSTIMAQNLQNANWYFGDHRAFSFTPPNQTSPFVISGSAMTTQESCASVSDTNGNLLFYTNGKQIWNNANLQMPNGFGLNGSASSTQGAVIVPKPGNPNRYYIFTINGATGDLSTEPNRGLYYTEVDVVLGDVVAGTKNTTMPGSSGASNLSEKLTATKHGNGNDYWVVTQTGTSIRSCRVTSTGVLGPTISSTSPVNTNTTGGSLSAAVGQMKISPDGQHIGICYNSGSIALGSFNNMTGAITSINLITASGAYSLEFSPNSQYLYFGLGDGISYTSTTTISVQSVTPSNIKGLLQLALNGKIYLSSGTSLYVMNNPNTPSSPSLNTIPIALGGLGNNLPQWVPMHGQDPCSSLTLTSEPNTTVTYAYRSNITAQINYIVDPGKNISMRARDFIVLKPDTHIKSNSLYHARIENCEIGGSLIHLTGDLTSQQEEESEASLLTKTNLFSLSPNPTTTVFTVQSTANIKHITVTSLDGRIMYNGDVRGKATSYTIDAGSYTQGIYSVTVLTETGETQTQKLIKN